MANISMKDKKDVFIRASVNANGKHLVQDGEFSDQTALLKAHGQTLALPEGIVPFGLQLAYQTNFHEFSQLAFYNESAPQMSDLVFETLVPNYTDISEYLNILDETGAGDYDMSGGGGFVIGTPNYSEAHVSVTLADASPMAVDNLAQFSVFQQPVFFYSVASLTPDSDVTPIVDLLPPTLSISSTSLVMEANETAQLTFKFSEAVNNFDQNDISVQGGVVSNLSQDANDPTLWQADFTADGSQIQISVAGNDYQDLAGNHGNDASLALEVLPTAVGDTILINIENASKIPGLLAKFYNTNNQLDGSGYSGGIIGEVESIMDNQDANATFVSSALNYNVKSGNLGSSGKLATWLGDDASTLTFDNQVNSSDAFIQFSGFMSFEAGVHNFRVRADDGYTIRIKIDGAWENIVIQNKNQSPTTTTHSDFNIPEDGYYEVEMLYWDQGGQYEFEVELRGPTTDNAYQILDDSLMSYPSANEYVISTDTLLANDSDAYGYTLSISAVSNAVGGTVHLNSDGDIVFTVNENYVGPLSFDYTVSDGYGGFNQATVALKYEDPTLHVDNGFGRNTAGTHFQGSLVEMGYDGGDSLTLNASLLPADLTADGDLITWQVSDNSLIGSVSRGGEAVSILALSVNPNDGTYDLEMFEAIDDPTVDDSPIQLNILFTATDNQGDSIEGQLDFVLSENDLSLAQLADQSGHFIMDEGDNLLLIDEAALMNFDGLVSGGAGIDTLKMDGSGTDLTAAQLSAHFGDGFEIIDLSDGGDNTINLSLEAVKDLSQDSELSVTDTNNNTYDHVLRIIGGDEAGESDIINTDTSWKEIGTTDSGSTLYQVGPDAAAAPIVELVDIPPQQIVEV